MLKRYDKPLPADYLNPPVIDVGNLFLWYAFWELTTERALGFGAEGRIPHSVIVTFARDHGIKNRDDVSWFLGVIRMMDAEYLGIRAPKKDPQVIDEVPMSNLSGIRGLLSRLAKKPQEPSEADE